MCGIVRFSRWQTYNLKQINPTKLRYLNDKTIFTSSMGTPNIAEEEVTEVRTAGRRKVTS